MQNDLKPHPGTIGNIAIYVPCHEDTNRGIGSVLINRASELDGYVSEHLDMIE